MVNRHILCLFFVAILLSHNLHAQTASLTPIGNLWVIAVDDSKQLPSAKKLQWNNSRWQEIAAQCPIDYAHDYVLCAYTGCNNNIQIPFGKQFVRLGMPQKWDNNQLTDCIHNALAHRSGAYSSAYVSVINYVTLEQVVKHLQKSGFSKHYRNIYVMTITSDGQELDTWNLDQRGIRKMGRLAEVLQAKQFVAAGGQLTKTIDKHAELPYVRVYKYVTKQSCPINDEQSELFTLQTMENATAAFALKSNHYRGDSITACLIDTIIMNRKLFPLAHLLQAQNSQQPLTIQGRNAFFTNTFEIHGTLRVAYTDSVYGAHFRDVHFVQKMEVTSPVFRHFCKVLLKIMLAVLAVLFVIFGLYLPLHRLYVIYVDGKKYIVRRGYSRHWRKNIPLLTVSFDENHHLRVVKMDSWRVSQRPLRHQPQPNPKNSYYHLHESILVKNYSPLTINKLKVGGVLENLGQYEVGHPTICMEYASTLSDLDNEKYFSSRMFYADWIRYEYARSLVAKLRKSESRLTLKMANGMAKCNPKHLYCIAFYEDAPTRIVMRRKFIKYRGIIDFEK